MVGGSVLSVLAALLVVALTVPSLARSLLLAERRDDLLRRAEVAGGPAAQYLSGELDPAQALALLRAVAAPGDVEVWLVDRQGTVVLEGGAEGETPEQTREVPGTSRGTPGGPRGRGSGFGGRRVFGTHLTDPDTHRVLGGQGWTAVGLRWPYTEPVVSVAVPVRGAGGAVIGALLLHSPVSGVAAVAARLRADLMLAAAVGLVVALGLAVVTGRSLSRRVAGISEMADRVARGDLDARVPEGPDELGRLGRTLNAMAQRLASAREEERRLEAARRELVASVSHDLRSPVTAIRGFVEPLFDGTVTDEATRRRYLETIRTETEFLGRLVGDLLELGRLEAGPASLRLEPVDLGRLVRETAERYGARAREAGLDLRVRVFGGLPPVTADEARVARALANLLDNAFRFSPRGGRVDLRVGLVRSPGGAPEVAVKVRDRGPGLDPRELTHVWERFWRADPARRRRRPGEVETTDGTGLGLAIVREVAQAHGGRVAVRSRPGWGSEFAFFLPVRVTR